MSDLHIRDGATGGGMRLKPTPALGLRLFADKNSVRYTQIHTHTHTRRQRRHNRLRLNPNNHAVFRIYADTRHGVCVPHTRVSFKNKDLYIYFVCVIGESHASRGFQASKEFGDSVAPINLEAAPCL